jgi:hypothetical protein
VNFAVKEDEKSIDKEIIDFFFAIFVKNFATFAVK